MTRKELESLYTAPQFFVTEDEEYRTPLEAEGGGYFVDNLATGESTIIPSLNLQTSRYHQESLMDHIAIVTGRMNCSHDPVAVAIGLLHDLGKKYTVKLNKNEEFCFYGHEELSAKIAEQLLADNNYFSEKDKKTIVAVISVHLQPKLLKGITLECFYEGFKKLYGERALDYLMMLERADRGVTEEYINSFITEKEISDGYEVIDKFLNMFF